MVGGSTPAIGVFLYKSNRTLTSCVVACALCVGDDGAPAAGGAVRRPSVASPHVSFGRCHPARVPRRRRRGLGPGALRLGHSPDGGQVA